MTTKELLDEYVDNADYLSWHAIKLNPRESEETIAKSTEARQQEIIKEIESSIRKEVVEEILEMIPKHTRPITSKKYEQIKKDNPHAPNICFFLGENIGRNGFRQSMYIVLRKYALSKGITLK